jgi:hypothetical protein
MVGKEFIDGIATSSHMDHDQEALVYHVHLENGYSIEINVGFVQVIQQNEDNDDYDPVQYANPFVDSQENEKHGRASSCEDPNDEEDNDDWCWPQEMLHSATKTFGCSPQHGTADYDIND